MTKKNKKFRKPSKLPTAPEKNPVGPDRTFTGPWKGASKIVVGIDIGTTYSGVAFAYLQKGSNQLLYRVDQWPGQQAQDYGGKIPSVVWYDSSGKAVAFGADAVTPQTKRKAEDQQWQLAEHFKLHLHPSNLRTKHGIALARLPNGVEIDRVYADFLRYLLEHTRLCFERVIADGKKVWQNYSRNMVFVIGHPNGWGIKEQKFLRDAAVAAGYATDENATDRVKFVSEAEASVHFCMHYTTIRSNLKPGTNFLVCDAGGSTVDSTLYTVEKAQPRIQLSEVRASACVQAGAMFVDKQAEEYLCRLFEAPRAKPPAEEDELVARGVESFEAQEKRRFNEDTDQADIEVAGSRYKNPRLGIRYGVLTLEGEVIQSFFDPCVDDILASVKAHVSSTEVSYMLLVGGFGSSPYLRQRLEDQFESSGCHVMTTVEATSKAVADGAVIWHCAGNVVKRAPRFAYGTDCDEPFDPSNPEHRGRPKFLTPDGIHVPGAWSEIVAKDVPVDCDAASRQSYYRQCWAPNPRLGVISRDIYAYEFGGLSNWLTNESGVLNNGFQKVCTVTADLSDMRGALQLAINPHIGLLCWFLSYNVCIRFGRTELEAFLEWEEEGTTMTGPAKIVPISDIE